jgi:hypothetical protein
MATGDDTNNGGGGGSKPKDEPKKATKVERFSVTGNNNDDSENDEPKHKRRINSHPRSRHNRRVPVPEARVVQEYNEYAYVSDSEHEENEREYLPRAIRRRTGGEVKVVKDRIRQLLEREEMENEVKNDASASSEAKFVFSGLQRHAKSKCHCFDCWSFAERI